MAITSLGAPSPAPLLVRPPSAVNLMREMAAANSATNPGAVRRSPSLSKPSVVPRPLQLSLQDQLEAVLPILQRQAQSRARICTARNLLRGVLPMDLQAFNAFHEYYRYRLPPQSAFKLRLDNSGGIVKPEELGLAVYAALKSHKAAAAAAASATGDSACCSGVGSAYADTSSFVNLKRLPLALQIPFVLEGQELLTAPAVLAATGNAVSARARRRAERRDEDRDAAVQEAAAGVVNADEESADEDEEAAVLSPLSPTEATTTGGSSAATKILRPKVVPSVGHGLGLGDASSAPSILPSNYAFTGPDADSKVKVDDLIIVLVSTTCPQHAAAITLQRWVRRLVAEGRL